MPLLEPTAFRDLLHRIAASDEVHALDIETTGLEPHAGATTRLVQVCGPATNEVPVVLDVFKVPGGLEAWAEEWEACRWCGFNSKFEQSFFLWEGIECEWHDVDILKSSVVGGARRSLKQMVKDDLGITMSKEEQASDWGAATLTPQQLKYAEDDAYLTWKLWKLWKAEALKHSTAQGYLNTIRVLPAIHDIEQTGLRIDKAHHQKLMNAWQAGRDSTHERLCHMFGLPEDFNLNSRHQLTGFFKEALPGEVFKRWPKTPKTKILKMDKHANRDMAMLTKPGILSKWLSGLQAYNRREKYLSSFGASLVMKADGQDIIRASTHLMAAITGRFSNSGPNAQQFPKSPSFRRCFVARPGRRLVIADYEQIELRVAAEIANEDNLRNALASGDVHRATASFMFHIPEGKVNSHQRRAAKTINFGILYGAGAGTIAANSGLSFDDAAEFIGRWLGAYPGVDVYRQESTRQMQAVWALRTVGGRRIVPPRFDPETGKPTGMPFASNAPIQGGAADVQIAGMYHTHRLLKETGLWDAGVRMAASVHDEILLCAPEGECSRESVRMLEQGMALGWQEMFPNARPQTVVQAKICQNWSEK